MGQGDGVFQLEQRRFGQRFFLVDIQPGAADAIVLQGFDQRLATAYDFNALGWQHEVLACDQMPGEPTANCSPTGDAGPSLGQLMTNFINGQVAWAGVVTPPDPTPGALDKRLVYDTRVLGNGAGGHVFSDVLTAQERRAILEYLKTL